MRPLVWTASIVSSLVCALAVAAEPSQVELVWVAPSECPSRAAVLAETRAILRDSTSAGRSVDARATVVPMNGGWHVDLAIRSDEGSGDRSFEAASCTELASAVALIVALAIDPASRAPTTIPDAGEAPRATEVTVPPPPAKSDGPHLALGAAAELDTGTLPSTALGAAATIAGLYGRARIEAHGSLFASQHVGDPANPSQGMDLSLATLGGRGCFAVLAGDRATLAPCLGFEGERANGSGVGGKSTFTNAGSWASLEGGLLGTWALASFLALRFDGELLVPLSRPRFVVLDPGGGVAEVLHRPGPLGGRFDLGAELRFW